MPRINLLPWREEQRVQRQKNFFMALGAAGVFAVLCIFYTKTVVDGQIEHQRERNRLLTSEIQELDKKITEILDLENQKERLLARMEIIEQLQRSRPEIVHLFDQMARTIPEGVYLKSVTQMGTRLEITGAAQSSTRVSAYMRNIDASDWMADPGLEVIETVKTGPDRDSEFKMNAKQVLIPTSEEEGI